LASAIRKAVTISFKETGVHIDKDKGEVAIRVSNNNSTRSLVDLSEKGINIVAAGQEEFEGIKIGTYNPTSQKDVVGVRLNDEGLLLGAGGDNSSAAVSIKPKSIIMGVGNPADLKDDSSGLKITNAAIDLYIQSITDNNTKITREKLDNLGLLFGVYNKNETSGTTTGTAVQIKEDSIVMGA